MDSSFTTTLLKIGLVLLFWLGPTLYVEFKRRKALKQIEELEVTLVKRNTRLSELAQYKAAERTRDTEKLWLLGVFLGVGWVDSICVRSRKNAIKST